MERDVEVGGAAARDTFATAALQQFARRRAGTFKWVLEMGSDGRAGGDLPDVTKWENQGKAEERDSASW